MFGLVLGGMLIACVVTLVVVPVTLAQSRISEQGEVNSKPWSALGWVAVSIVSFGVWAIVSFMLLVSHNGNPGIRGLVGEFVLFAGPALYLYIGYRIIEKARSWQREPPE